MSKTRRTRQEKEIATLRRKVRTIQEEPSSTPVESPQYRFSGSKTAQSYIPQSPTLKLNYSHVIHDARNTLFITVFLLGIQIILYILIQKNIIDLPQFGF